MKSLKELKKVTKDKNTSKEIRSITTWSRKFGKKMLQGMEKILIYLWEISKTDFLFININKNMKSNKI